MRVNMDNCITQGKAVPLEMLRAQVPVPTLGFVGGGTDPEFDR